MGSHLPEGARPFQVAVPDAAVAGLRERLRQTLWPARHWGTAADWSYGTPEPYLRDLLAYWADDFGWRAAEARINAFPQFMIDIDGLDTHVLHVRSPHADATPLLLVHGWPGSIVEFLEVIPRLTEPERFGGDRSAAYHVVCPSLPGYAFSQAPQAPGMTPRRIAAQHAELMTRLGYDRFVAQGGDWGAICCRYLADSFPERLIGLHVNLTLPTPPTGLENAEAVLSEAERKFVADWAVRNWDVSGYSHVQATKPQTLAYGLSDSPAGLAAWITEKFHTWTDNRGDPRDAVSWDALLTNIALYWFTNSIGSSVRLYKEYFDALAQGDFLSARDDDAPKGDFPGARCEVPTGIARYPAEFWAQPATWARLEYNIVHWFEAAAGGHFAAMEQPGAFAADLWAFHGRLKQTP